MIIRWSEIQHYFTSFELVSIFSSFFWLFGVGLIFSVISQAGFFAYLTIHRFGLGIFKSLWNPVQILLVLFVVFDLVYLRYTSFEAGEGISSVYFTCCLCSSRGRCYRVYKSETNK